MVETGKSLLRLIQNNGTPTLDLLVRESIQNSLDAALKDDESEYVDVSITTSDFETKRLAPHFQGIENNLCKMYPGKRSYIAIADKNTS